MALFMLCCC